MPLPPYIHEKLKDKDRYQNVYATVLGSAACPTAGLHFTPELNAKLLAKGIQIEEVHIHASIKAIYVWAFHGCYNLKYINIPSSCELIDESAIDCRHENGTEPKDDDIYNTGTLKVVFEPDTKIKELKHAAIANAAKMIIYIYNKVDATCGWNFGSDLESKYVIYSPYIYKFCSMYKTTIIQNITCKQNIRISLSCFFILLSMQ